MGIPAVIGAEITVAATMIAAVITMVVAVLRCLTETAVDAAVTMIVTAMSAGRQGLYGMPRKLSETQERLCGMPRKLSGTQGRAVMTVLVWFLLPPERTSTITTIMMDVAARTKPGGA